MSGQAGTIVQVNTSKGGVPKLPVLFAAVDRQGLSGDDQREKEFHGGPERAVCLFAIERIDALNGEGHPIRPGDAGENITTRGIDWERVVPGSRLRLGDQVLLEITDYAAPCKTIKAGFSDGNFNRMNQKVHPGWSRTYARVLVPGTIRPGDAIVLFDGAGGDGGG